MTRKLQQFYILKFESDRLRDDNYTVGHLTIEDARLNAELVSIGDSQLIRTIQRLTNKQFSQIKLNELVAEKKRLSSRKNNINRRNKLKDVIQQIDELLFIPELVSIKFTNKSHYVKILDRGFFAVNGRKYVPFMASSGMIRRNTALFIQEEWKEKVIEILNNGRNLDTEIAPAKFSAYFALYSSSSLPVTFPKIAVVPDLNIKTLRKVEYTKYTEENVDPLVEQREMELECNAFDGQGLVSPEMARRWSQDLDLDYIPSSFIVRAPYIKGLSVVFDFHRFAEEVAGTYSVRDVYGNNIDVQDVDVLVSESQFKLWNAYASTQCYYENCKKNELGWGIARPSPRTDKTYAMSSYQFLQVLKLTDEDLKILCEPTIRWISQVSAGDIVSTLLYLMGDVEYMDGWFERLDPLTQALLLNHEMLKDSYLLSHLEKSLAKKKKDAMMGRLIFSGNYSMAIADPYLQCCHIFDTKRKIALLQEGKHYSNYWMSKREHIPYVAAIRSPIVHHSEVNILHFEHGTSLEDWYRHIKSGIIFPANGIGMDFAINGGMDVDGDLICTIDNPAIVLGKQDGLPIIYDTQKASKMSLRDSDRLIYESHYKGFGTRVGFYTNVSTAYYSMLENFPVGSKERQIIEQRLKYGRTLQGLEIDKQKGLIIPPFPEHWTKFKKITDEMSEEEKEYWRFNNSLLADKRPYFMRWLYSHYNTRYSKELKIYDNISYTKWGINFQKLLNADFRTTEQEKLVSTFRRKTYFIDNNSTMNRISRYMERELKKIKLQRRADLNEFDFTILLSGDFVAPSALNIDKMLFLYKQWKSLKRNLNVNRDADSEDFSDISQINRHINSKAYAAVSSDSAQLADMAVYLCYNVLGKTSRSFCWQVFGKEIVANIRSKRDEKFVRVPQKSETGAYDYLWSKYGMYLINVEA